VNLPAQALQKAMSGYKDLGLMSKADVEAGKEVGQEHVEERGEQETLL